MPRGGNRGQVHDGVEAGVAVLQAQEHVHHLAVVAQVHLREPAAARARPVQVGHLVAVLAQPPDDAPSQFSASSGNSNSHQDLLGWQDLRTVMVRQVVRWLAGAWSGTGSHCSTLRGGPLGPSPRVTFGPRQSREQGEGWGP